MEVSLRAKLASFKLQYADLPAESIELVYNLYCQGIRKEPTTGIECFYFGSYYHYIQFNGELTKKYYLQALELGIEITKPELVRYYCFYENTDITRSFIREYLRTYKETEFHWLGFLYKNLGEYDQMKKYYLLAIEEGNVNSMNNLGFYYNYVELNLPLAKKYYLQAIKQNDITATWNLSIYYREKKKAELQLFYLKKSAILGYPPAIKLISVHYLNKPVKKKYLLFGLRHQQTNLIIKHYIPKYVHYLLQGCKEDISPLLVDVRQEYLTNLFAWYQRKDTWFKYYCVKDITGMVQSYLQKA